jgi:hypothetical protein
MDEFSLQELCALWQQRLRLQDWVIRISIKRARAMRGAGGALGYAQYERSLKSAEIVLMDPIDHDEEDFVHYDLEQTLVHELLHLHFAGYEAKEGSPEHLCLEQAIDLSAYALIEAWRR